MCLAIPAFVEQLTVENHAIVNLSGIRKEISLVLVEDIVPGDYVIVHVGFALQKLDPLEAERTLAMFAEISSHNQE
ncbi:MAG: HypC/HybG/HupF family hydrogenase formation chaperone [Proteobacteria bacterium]|nr:HypC/HybG/HupF family hydrogenase formation chaperone [Pseudomonadota bacterium]